jgi:fatty acid desaturase
VDEVFARRDVIDTATLRRLCQPSDAMGLAQTTTHVGTLVVTGALLWSAWGTWWAVPFFMAHGVLLNFLYAGQHELSHWTVFRTRWLNEWVGRAFGFILFYPRTFDQVQHMAHHRFTSNWTEDGELARPRYTRRSYLLWMTGLSYWYTRWLRIARFCAGIVTEPYLPAQASCGNHSRSALACRGLCAHCRRIHCRAQRRRVASLDRAHDRHEIRAPIAEHHRAPRSAA